MIALAPAAKAWANDECGAATQGGSVVCEADGSPYPGIRYEAVNDLEVVLKEGAVVDGAPVVIEGDGPITFYAEDGTVIRSIAAYPAVDVLSLSGPVSVRVDEVYGGAYGVTAVSYGDVSVSANYVEADHGIRAQSLGDGDVMVDAGAVVATRTGIFAWSDTGDVGVNAGLVFVQGENALGIDAFTQEGSIGVQANEVLAIGEGAVGIQGLVSVAGDVGISADYVGVGGGDNAWAIYGETAFGSVDVSVGFAEAWGNGALGVAAISYDGGNVNVAADTVSAYGDGSVGIYAFAGNGDVSIDVGYVSAWGDIGGGALGVYAFNGAAQIDLYGAATTATYARAIDVVAFGEVSLNTTEVMTFGDLADAINIATVGDVDVNAGRVVTYGLGSNAVVGVSSGHIDLNVDEIATWGDWSQAIWASGDSVNAVVGTAVTRAETGEAAAVFLQSNTGIASLTVKEAVASFSSEAVRLESLFGGAELTVDEGAYVFGKTTAVATATALGATLNIAGTVESLDGPVIAAFGDLFGNDPASGAADIRIGSTGSVRGTLLLSGGDDQLTNAGSFLTNGQSDFGAGDDSLVNHGVIALRDEWSKTISFTGLEQLDNHGLISLANDHAGDMFTLSGTLEGHAGGKIGIDLDLQTGIADQIQVGSLAGTNTLHLNLVGGGSGLGLDNVHVLTSDTVANGDELVLAAGSQSRGFVGFNVKHDGFGDWFLESDLTDASYLAGALPSGVRDLWRAGVNTVSSHLLATRSGEAQDGGWVQVVGGEFDGDSRLSHAQGSRDLSWQGSHSGVQLGLEKSFGGWQAGFTAGYGKARMDLGGAERTDFDSLNLGLYASYASNGWYTSAMLRGDMLDMETKWQSIGLQDSGDASTIGLNLEGGRRFSMGAHAWVQPSVSVAWVDVDLPTQEGTYGDVHWTGGSTMTGQLGLSMGTDAAVFGLPLHPYLSMSLAREFNGKDETVFDLNTEEARVSDAGNRTYGRVASGLSYQLGRFDLFAEIDTRFGDVEGVSGRLGARINF